MQPAIAEIDSRPEKILNAEKLKSSRNWFGETTYGEEVADVGTSDLIFVECLDERGGSGNQKFIQSSN